MTDDPRKTDPAEAPPAGAGADDPEAPGDASATASAPPEPANDSDAAADSDPATADSGPGAADTAAGDAKSAEPDANPQEGEGEAPALTEEQQRIADLETEVAELKDRALRALADADNARKRAARDVADSRKYGATGLARDVLSVADNLGRALEAVPEIPREEDENLFNLRAGVDMTRQEMLQALERHGVKKVTPETGERFDHNRHQAMFEVPTDELAPGAVAQVVQDGYVIHDRLLRPALVGVARKPPEEPAPEAGETAEDAAEAPEDAAEPPEENAGESDAA
ncbi:MAG: nucleotide exchange factor GrpE [Rhodospirillaceae bacterium]|nr:nucleotide exchange factor GrpE [Rhodospirillaceae bacterium]MDE0617581.1 nucleotide exchange factor GrpE [Rhodospirillaceae bacterium]